MDGLGPPAIFNRRRFGILYALRWPVRSTRSGLRLPRGTYIPRRGVPRNARFGLVNFTRSRRTHCARVHCTSPPRTIYSSTRPRRPFSSTRSCLRLLRDFAQRAGSITPLQLEVLCRCSTHTHARRRRLPRCRFAPPRPNRHLLCGAAAAPSSPQSNISTLASFASRRHFLDGPRLGPPRVSSGSLPSTPFYTSLQAGRQRLHLVAVPHRLIRQQIHRCRLLALDTRRPQHHLCSRPPCAVVCICVPL